VEPLLDAVVALLPSPRDRGGHEGSLAALAFKIVFDDHGQLSFVRVYRGALENVSATQWDAAIALNFSTFDIYRRVIIPQAIPAAIPAAGNFLIYMFKDSPLLFAIGVAELMHASVKIGADNFQYLEPVTIVGIIFLGLSLISALMLRVIESRVGRAWR
jgi:polar amino acid transport system permease protein